MNANSASLSIPPDRLAYTRWGIAVGTVILFFSIWLIRLAAFSIRNELYSHILLIPILAGYFVWLKRNRLPMPASQRSWVATSLAALAAVLICILVSAKLGAISLAPDDELFLSIGAAVASLVAVTVRLLGARFARAIAFPLAFLALMIPMPVWARDHVETLLQIGSSYAALAMFKAVGMPVYHDGFVFQLPGVSLEVAPECSGIHSTVALLVTSLAAGYLFLRSPWRRSTLALLVLPIAVLRNGFRVFTLGELCVHFGANMLDSPIHHHGGPVFFIVSLIPFGAALVWLVRSERRRPHLAAA